MPGHVDCFLNVCDCFVKGMNKKFFFSLLLFSFEPALYMVWNLWLGSPKVSAKCEKTLDQETQNQDSTVVS
jgi:hypothetical protein